MRVLVIDEATEQRAQEIMAYARSHVYYPDLRETMPGADSCMVLDINTYHCVFSYTKSSETGNLYRHLSISVPGDLYPNPFAVSLIADLFEFTEAIKGVEQRVKDGAWTAFPDKLAHCIVVVEELKG